MNTPTLETERLILRKFTEHDLEALYRIYSDKEVNRFLPWFPLETLKDAKLFYEEQWQPKDILVTFRMYQLNLDGTEGRVYKEYWNHSTVHFIETDA